MVRQISTTQLHERMTRGEALWLLDVRQPWEHDTAALPQSVLIPLGELSDRLDEVTPPQGAEVIVYCHHGIRSLSGAAILEQAGLAAASLAGGIDAWSLTVDPSVPRY